jgi:Phage integrase family
LPSAQQTTGLARITFHDLRHSSAAGALKAGVSPTVVSERIGHADVGFFLQIYAHVLKNDDRAAAEQAASYLIGAGWDTQEAERGYSCCGPTAVPAPLTTADFGLNRWSGWWS